VVDVNNRNNCGGDVVSNMALHYTVRFTTAEHSSMSWHVPLDLGWGGMILVDGEIAT